MKTKVIIFTILGIILAASLSFAGNKDLDDGISHYTDNPITQEDQLPPGHVNVGFVILEAKSKIYSINRNWETVVDKTIDLDKSATINSVLVSPGAQVYGEIYVIDEGEGKRELTITP